MNKPLIAIVGETASGKTAAAIEAAQKFDGEIICADSRTVYRYLDIGTAKPTKQEQAVVPHHLLDIVEPDEIFIVADFKKLADASIIDIHARGKLPILVGGTGLYIDAVLYDYQFSPEKGAKDSKNPRHLAPDTPRRRSELRSNTCIVGLQRPVEQTKERISHRVDAMLEAGFIEEVTGLVTSYPQSRALDATSYKAIRQYVEGRLTLDEAKKLFTQNDTQLAKRQRTWFRRNKAIVWSSSSDQLLDVVSEFMKTQQNEWHGA